MCDFCWAWAQHDSTQEGPTQGHYKSTTIIICISMGNDWVYCGILPKEFRVNRCETMHESPKDPTQAHPYYSHARTTTRVISSFIKLFLSNVRNFSTSSLQLKKTNVSWLQKDTWFSIYFLIKNKTKKSRRAIHGHNVNDGASNFKWQHISPKTKNCTPRGAPFGWIRQFRDGLATRIPPHLTTSLP